MESTFSLPISLVMEKARSQMIRLNLIEYGITKDIAEFADGNNFELKGGLAIILEKGIHF